EKILKSKAVLADLREREMAVQETEWMLRTGSLLYEAGYMEEAFEYQVLGERRLKKLGVLKYPHMAYHFIGIGSWYHRQSNYEEAIEAFRYVLPHRKTMRSDGSFAHVFNSMGMCFQK